MAGILGGLAGTLDDAPFRIALPSEGWTLSDSAAQSMGKGVSLVAIITQKGTQLKSLVIKTEFENPSATSFDDLCAGIRDSFGNPAVKKLSDEPAAFLGFKGRRFTYEVNGTSYNEAMVFVSGHTGWTIACTGTDGQKEDITKVFTFYQPKQ